MPHSPMPRMIRASFLALVLLAGGAVPAAAATRTSFIAAEPVLWDYAPSGRDLIMDGPIPRPWTRHTTWRKVRYVEYTDATYASRKPQPAWLGVLGPVLRAEVGDTVVVHFLNRSTTPVGMHPHGLRYDKDNEGAQYGAPGAGAAVPPGGAFTYTWLADEDSGPGPADPSSIVWWYHSHVDEPADVNAGLLGPLIVTRRGMANADGTPRDVAREFVLLFMIFAESTAEPGLMHSINGYIFGNLPGLVAREGETVRWHVLGMGNEVDLHTAHWHGKTLLLRQRRTDVVELLPGSMATADMRADNPGTWLLHCHVADHIHAGMAATYTIAP